MISVKGIIKNGVVEPLEPIEGQDGQEVMITLTEEIQEDEQVMTDSDWEQLNQILEECQMDVSISDLAHQHDHYLYGTPKKRRLTQMKVFVDTAAWIALLNTNDNLHQQVTQVRDRLQQQKVSLLTTEFILIEVADALCSPGLRSKTITFLQNLRLIRNLQVIPISQELMQEGWQLYSQRLDKDWGLTDCTSFVVMEREKITQAFTSDHHFEQAGFVKLL